MTLLAYVFPTHHCWQGNHAPPQPVHSVHLSNSNMHKPRLAYILIKQLGFDHTNTTMHGHIQYRLFTIGVQTMVVHFGRLQSGFSWSADGNMWRVARVCLGKSESKCLNSIVLHTNDYIHGDLLRDIPKQGRVKVNPRWSRPNFPLPDITSYTAVLLCSL